MNNMNDVCAIILAAGKGTRMSSTDQNKATIPVAGKPIIQRITEILKATDIKDIVAVVGFAKDSVVKLLDADIIIAEQNEAKGTGDAVKIALPKVPENDKNVLVLYGDDAFWFTPEILQNLYAEHIKKEADVTFCTTILDDPTGLGRIIRDSENKVIDIVEEKATTDGQKAIKEVNLGGFLFKKELLEKNIADLPQNPASGEYYLTDFIPLTAQRGARIETLKLENFTWRGINTPQDLEQAEGLLH
ncbi:MAG: sugar phosphate nucleotidyltransferase [Candidatus Daviesbacteria bacterium]|nr:sugar phosphate nucleotidyltransferase [Candidatus Daviesbacteria bacterium]